MVLLAVVVHRKRSWRQVQTPFRFLLCLFTASLWLLHLVVCSSGLCNVPRAVYLGQPRDTCLQKRLNMLYAHVLSQIQDDVSCASILPERFTASLKKPVYLNPEDYACSLVWNRQEGFSVSQDRTDGSLWGRLSYNLRKQISSQTVEGHAALLFMSSFAICPAVT